MDADNRVVLNCGGIRHEVYKVDDEKLMNLIYMYVCCRPLDPLGQKIEIKKTVLFIDEKKLHNVFSCEEAALEGLTDVSGSQTIVYIVMHLYVPSL